MITLKKINKDLIGIYMKGSASATDKQAHHLGNFTYVDSIWMCVIKIPICKEVLTEVLKQFPKTL